mgnify:CR=1 FL=1
MIYKFAEQLRLQMRAQMNDICDYVAGGGCPSYDDYRAKCGEIAGLAQAERLLIDLREVEEKGVNGE